MRLTLCLPGTNWFLFLLRESFFLMSLFGKLTCWDTLSIQRVERDREAGRERERLQREVNEVAFLQELVAQVAGAERRLDCTFSVSSTNLQIYITPVHHAAPESFPFGKYPDMIQTVIKTEGGTTLPSVRLAVAVNCKPLPEWSVRVVCFYLVSCQMCCSLWFNKHTLYKPLDQTEPRSWCVVCILPVCARWARDIRGLISVNILYSAIYKNEMCFFFSVFSIIERKPSFSVM